MSKKPSTTILYIVMGLVAIAMVAAGVLSWALSRTAAGPLEIGQLWFNAGSFVATGSSVVLLVWTFYEQRKQTEAQSRAYIEIVGARYAPPVRWRNATLRIGVKNLGETPASDIHISGTQKYDPGAVEGREVGTGISSTFEYRIPGDLAAEAQDVAQFGVAEVLEPPENKGGRSHGTESCRMPLLTFKGVIRYTDAFNRPRELPFTLTASSVGDYDATELSGAGRQNY